MGKESSVALESTVAAEAEARDLHAREEGQRAGGMDAGFPVRQLKIIPTVTGQ